MRTRPMAYASSVWLVQYDHLLVFVQVFPCVIDANINSSPPNAHHLYSILKFFILYRHHVPQK